MYRGAVGYVYRGGGGKLSDKEQEKLLQEYDLLPRNKAKQVELDFFRMLSSKWGVSDYYLRSLVKKRKQQRG